MEFSLLVIIIIIIIIVIRPSNRSVGLTMSGHLQTLGRSRGTIHLTLKKDTGSRDRAVRIFVQPLVNGWTTEGSELSSGKK
jgi:hypothetical protein